MQSILDKSIKEAKQILNAMHQMVKELEMLEEEKEESKDQQFKLIETMIEQDTLLEPDDDYYK